MRKILSKFKIIAILLVVSGCSEYSSREAFFVMLKNQSGQNFDSKIKTKTLSANFNKGDGHIELHSDHGGSVYYIVTWFKDCTYISKINKKTRIIENSYVYHDTISCRQQGY